MASIIHTSGLCKEYIYHQKEEGLAGSLKSLWRRELKSNLAVDHISFTIEQGKIVGLIGPNGAGKTTTLKLLSGLIYPTAGQVEVMGFVPWNRAREFQRNLSFVFGQKQQLWWDLPALESFRLNKEIYQIPDDVYRETLKELTELLDVEPLLTVQVRKLSLGERMKMEIIAALLHRPRLVFLDEPTIGLDTMSQKKIIHFFREYNLRHGATIILTSHYMKDIQELCEEIMLINKGRLIYNGKLSYIIKNYCQSKHLTVTFEEPPEPESLARLGGKIHDDPYNAVFVLKRRDIVGFVNQVMNLYPVADLNIADEPLEEIIERMLNNEAVSAGVFGNETNTIADGDYHA